MELLRFADMWCDKGHKPKTVDEVDLKRVESYFDISLPADYLEQIIAVGLPWAPELLDAILDKQLDLNDLSNLCPPDEIIEETEGWRPIGLPEDLLVIGGDCMGNKFCFGIPSLSKGPKPSSAVFFWDHDFGTTTQIAESFSKWISGYVHPWDAQVVASD